MRKMLIPLCCGLLLLFCACQHTPSTASSVDAAIPSAEPSNSETSALTSYPTAEEVQTLTIARVENNRYISEAIEAFNNLDTAQQLESVWYAGNEGELKLSLISGDGPDLISLDGFEYETYAAKGVFVNLYDYLNNDPDITPDQLVQPALKAMEWSDHALYQISPTYYLQSMYVSHEVWDSTSPWDLDHIEAWMDTHPDSAFTNAVETPAELLTVLLRGYLPSFIDYTQMTCDFTSDRFIRLLEDASSWSQRDWKDAITEQNAFQNGSILCGWNQLSSFDGYKELSDQGLTNSVGFPSDGDPCVFVGSVIRFGICGGTGRESAAWEFIKTTLSADYQKIVPWLPLLKSELSVRAQEAEKEIPPTVTDAFANPADAAAGTNMGTVSVTLPPVKGLTEEEIRDMEAVLDQASTFSGNTNVEIWVIIYDEVDAYFSGQKTAEEVAEIIQNRVSIYLAERD
mgnify:CR=1 FL=1